jgi:hypothetical protein
MTTTIDRAKQAIPLLQAIVEGKTLQTLVGTNHWVDCDVGDWLLREIVNQPELCRIKPQPREFWLVKGSLPGCLWIVWDEQPPKMGGLYEQLHVIEAP